MIEAALLAAVIADSRARAIGEVGVVDAERRPVPEPATEPIDPEPEVELMVRWDGEPGEERLTFRSSWLAWQAARRLRGLATPGPTG